MEAETTAADCLGSHGCSTLLYRFPTSKADSVAIGKTWPSGRQAPTKRATSMTSFPRKKGIKATSAKPAQVRTGRVSSENDQEFYGGLIRLHILHHAAQEPVFGLWLIEELQRHGYRIGPGTLYPILHGLEERGFLRSSTQTEGRAVRRMYSATAKGRSTLKRAKGKVRELFGEILED